MLRVNSTTKQSSSLRRLFVILINLLLNAIQAMNKEGTITISVKQSDQILSIFVTDNGPGISEDNHQKIFDPFFTTKKMERVLVFHSRKTSLKEWMAH
jgi:C4-dicarboxylate-specific signal transduction histidine kinase